MYKPIIYSIENILHNKNIDADERIAEIKKIITEQQAYKNQTDKDSKSLIDLFKTNLETIENDTLESKLISSGYTDLDRLISGFGMGELIVVGARPAMGKTTLLVNLVLKISLDHPVLFFSYDLSESSFISRIISNISLIPSDRIINNKLDATEKDILKNIEPSLNRHQVYINETYSNSMVDFRLHCEKMISEKGVKVVFVDYIQMMSSNKFGSRRELEISYISRELKRLAKELNICVVATSQLSRAVEQRGGDKKPMLSDLRESGSIEQDADKVIFVYRPEYYGFLQDEDGNSTLNLMQLLVAKNRNGLIGEVDLICNFSRSDISAILDHNNPLNNLTSSANGFNFSKDRLNEINNDSREFDDDHDVDNFRTEKHEDDQDTPF